MTKFHLNKCFLNSPVKFSDIYLLQIGRLYFDADDIIKLHVHKDFFELTIITDGEGEIITNGHTTSVKHGDIYLSLPCDMHEIRSSKKAPMKYDFFSFYTENEDYKKVLDGISGGLQLSDRVFSDERIASLVGDAIMEFINDTVFSNDLLYSIFNQIIIYIIRHIKKEVSNKASTASLSEAICYQIMNYIDTHIYTLKTLDEIAIELNYNYSYISSLFKKTTGNTIFSYYNSKRLEISRQLIAERNQKITEIAEALNYSSLYSFSHAFKEKYGTSPKKYSYN